MCCCCCKCNNRSTAVEGESVVYALPWEPKRAGWSSRYVSEFNEETTSFSCIQCVWYVIDSYDSKFIRWIRTYTCPEHGESEDNLNKENNENTTS